VIVKSRQLKERTLKCVLISFYFFLATSTELPVWIKI